MRAGERTPIATANVSEADGPRLVLDGCRIPVDAEQLTLRWWDDNDVAWEARASVEAFEETSGRLTVAIVGGWGPAVLRQAARVDTGRTPVELLTLGGDGRVIRSVRALCLDLSPLGCRVAGTGPELTAGDDLQVAVGNGGRGHLRRCPRGALRPCCVRRLAGRTRVSAPHVRRTRRADRMA